MDRIIEHDVVHEQPVQPVQPPRNNNTALIVLLVILIVILFLVGFGRFGRSLIPTHSAPTINVPKQIDVNVNKPK